MNPIGIGRPIFVTLDEALAYHELSLAQSGGTAGIREIGLLESAIAQARSGLGGVFDHEYPFEMAAAYAFHVAKNHPFVDGNKRTALMCCGAFLRKNGWSLMSVGVEAADAILALIAGSMDKSTFAVWLQDRCAPRPAWELRDFFGQVVLGDLKLDADASSIGTTAQRENDWKEAIDAIPVIEKFARAYAMKLEQVEQLRGESRAEAMRTVGEIYAYGHLLVMLHRIAKDRGYEW